MEDLPKSDKPIRVLHVIGIMNRGGAESIIMNLYRHIDRSNIQFDFVENTDEKAAYDDEIQKLGGRIYHCPHFNGKNYFAYKKWWETFFRKHHEEYKIIHGHIGSTAAIYLSEARKAGLYTIAHSHSSGTDHSLKSALYKLLSYPTRNIADYFFACSEVAGMDRYGAKVTKSNHYKVLQNAIDTSGFQYNPQVRNEVRDSLHFADHELIIGHIGRFTSEKNHVFILDIFKEILKKNEASKLLLIGDGPQKQQIENRAGELNISEHIIFTGVRADVNRLIQAMDVFVFPSIYEGLPVTLVETQTSGLPIVMSDKVPTESILTDDLVTVCNLSDPPEKWAETVLECARTERKDRSAEIISAGYDISETAKWLGDFYLAKYNER